MEHWWNIDGTFRKTFSTISYHYYKILVLYPYCRKIVALKNPVSASIFGNSILMVIAVNLQANTLILKEQVWEICPWRIFWMRQLHYVLRVFSCNQASSCMPFSHTVSYNSQPFELFPAQLLSIDIIPYCQFLKIIITSSTAKGKGNLKISLQWNEKRLFICKTLSENTTHRCGDFRDKRLGDKSDTHNFA